ncbi:putative abieta-7,13-dien-18-ol hydroxylase [Helianthus annuus]|nr:putative abieta-7,13-dien-18-ol hydroxylase [Helianthus annuus]
MTMDIIGNAVFILPVITTLFLLIILLYIYNEHQLHGKKYHPVGGTVLSMLINYKRLHHYMSDLSAKYKTYRLLSPFRNEVYTSDPANVEYILKTNFENYGKVYMCPRYISLPVLFYITNHNCAKKKKKLQGAYLYNTNKELLGDGIFAVDGDKWREQRKVSSSQFSMKVLRDFSTIIFKKYAIKLGNILSEAASSKQKMDINVSFYISLSPTISYLTPFMRVCVCRAVNELNVQPTVREPFGGKFIYVRSISLTNEHEHKISFG